MAGAGRGHQEVGAGDPDIGFQETLTEHAASLVDEIRHFIHCQLTEIAPDAELDELGGADSLRETLDLDSMDFLALMRAIQEELGVDIPEADYKQVDSMDGCVAYIARARA